MLNSHFYNFIVLCSILKSKSFITLNIDGDTMKIIIAGAGLTGLTYALLLKRNGYEVEVYEKRPIEDIKKLDRKNT